MSTTQRDETVVPLAVGCLKFVGVLAAVFLAMAVIAGIGLYLSVESSFGPRSPEAVPQAWVTRDVVLDPASPVIRGSLNVSANTDRSSVVGLGVNASAPTATSSPGTNGDGASPAVGLGAALTMPDVRLTVRDAFGGAWQCDAPCELALPGFSCGRSGCTAVYQVDVELAGSSAAGSPVKLSVSGGGTVPRGAQLPGGFTVDLALGATPKPGGS
jgi:hypothetical protein